MAQTGYTPISLYYSATGAAVPTAGNLAAGELALNTNDGKLYYKNSSGVVTLLAGATAGPAGGSTTQIQYNNAGALAGNGAMTFNSGTSTTTLTRLNLTNALGVAYGGTGLTAGTSGGVLAYTATGVLASSTALAANALVIGGGAGAAPSTTTTGTGVLTFLGTPSSANLAAAVTDETGSGALVFGTSPTFTTSVVGGATMAVFNTTSTTVNAFGAATALNIGAATGTLTVANTTLAAKALTATSITNSALTATRLVYSGTAGLEVDSANLTFNGTDLTVSGAVNAGSINATTLDLTNLEVTNIKAKDGTASIALADTTGIATFSKATVISTTDNTNAALRITQLGTGNALLVEDSTNPDSTPFVIDTNGNVVSGYTNSINTTAQTGSVVAPGIQQHATVQGFAALGIYSWSSNAGISPNLIFSKSNSGTINTRGTVASGTLLGASVFDGDDGTNFIRAATIEGWVDGTPGVNDMPGRLVFSTTADGASTPTERMRIDSAGRVSIGGTPATGRTLAVEKTMTGGINTRGIVSLGVVQSDVTSQAYYFATVGQTAAAAFTLANLVHYYANQSTIGATSTVTNQYGFDAENTLTGATNNYGFYSSIAAGTNRYNFYAAGTADNYFAGGVGIGAVSTSAAKANITSTSAGASTIALSLQNASNTINSETVLDFVTNTQGAGVRSAQITAINTNGGTGVNMLFKIGNAAVATEAMRITSLGGLQIQTGVGVGAATPGASGVAFPATAIAVADANTLDDYEEGAWTPVVTFTGGNGDLTTAEAVGVYTKIGRLVQIAFNVEFTETTALTNLTITGVPFTSGGTTRTFVGCWVDNMTALVGSPVACLGVNATTIAFNQTTTGAATSITNVNTGASSRIRGSISYSI